MWVDCLTFSGRSLRLLAVGGLYTFVPSVLSGISFNLSIYHNAVRVLYRSSLGRCPWGVRIWGYSANVALICLAHIIT